jgi:hypothetical protein
METIFGHCGITSISAILFAFFENCVAPENPAGGYTHPAFKTKDKTERIATLHVSIIINYFALINAAVS